MDAERGRLFPWRRNSCFGNQATRCDSHSLRNRDNSEEVSFEIEKRALSKLSASSACSRANSKQTFNQGILTISTESASQCVLWGLLLPPCRSWDWSWACLPLV